MQVICQPVGPLQANCYIVVENQNALLIDPGDDPMLIDAVIYGLKAKIEAILLTHGHFDHIGAVDALAEKYQVPVYMNPAELATVQQGNAGDFMEAKNVAMKTTTKALKEGEQKIGSFTVNAWYAPGHSVGSTIIQIGNCLFTGDVLFQESIGRTDLAGGSMLQMKESLEYLKSLSQDYEVYPGHGPSTTLNYEKTHNVYLLHTNML